MNCFGRKAIPHTMESRASPSPARGSWRKHKAWGGAQRNPRNLARENCEARGAAERPMFRLAFPSLPLSAAPRALKVLIYRGSWGFAALLPRLYAVARYRGLGLGIHF